MHGQLEERVKEALVAEWQDSNRERTSSVLSSKVYERLVRAGVEVPEGEMERILTKLRKLGLIRGAQGHDTAYKVHGAFVIQGIDDELLLRH